ncbi:MAG: phosphoadenylyl-sulfate reductase [Ginsengibacter sp.]
MKDLQSLEELLKQVSVEEGLQKVAAMYPGKVKFSSSLGQEDQVLTDMISRNSIDISIFTLDTGRLFNETYELLEKTELRYKKKIEIFFPKAQAVQEMVNKDGINLFYNSVEERKMCCNIRKVEPLNRALSGASVWITGLRSSQTTLRHELPLIEWLPEKQLIKYNPLLHWSYDEVMEYINFNSVPYNPLHDKGFVSIGCAPCTRAIEPGEDPRAGRWWWESSHKECGLHVNK